MKGKTTSHKRTVRGANTPEGLQKAKNAALKAKKHSAAAKKRACYRAKARRKLADRFKQCATPVTESDGKAKSDWIQLYIINFNNLKLKKIFLLGFFINI